VQGKEDTRCRGSDDDKRTQMQLASQLSFESREADNRGMFERWSSGEVQEREVGQGKQEMQRARRGL
jgi:hypothetical protein